MNHSLKAICILMIPLSIRAVTVEHTVKPITDISQQVSVNFSLDKGEILYTEGLTPTVNNPHFSLSPLENSVEPVSVPDQLTKTTQEGFTEPVRLLFSIEQKDKEAPSSALIHMFYRVNTKHEPQELTIPVDFSHPSSPTTSIADETQKPYVPAHTSNQVPSESALSSLWQKLATWVSHLNKTWQAQLTSFFHTTSSGWLRFLAALILGILLSLTPCIYPMIPITIGILNDNQSKSTFRNFLRAASYTAGISTTFAILGLLASASSIVFGEVQGSPWVIIPFIILLVYLGLSMLGLYEMYIPRFLQTNNHQFSGGSLLSCFMFGLVSGTIASPCSTPGLVLILKYVSGLGLMNSIMGIIEGFMLLFVFGIGTSMPLLLIGTFSSSIDILPRAGLWMVEVKKLLGLLLLGTALYQISHLQSIAPLYVLLFIIAAATALIGIYYFATVEEYDTPAIKRFKNIMGLLIIITACFIFWQGYKEMYDHSHPQQATTSKEATTHTFEWLTNYDEAEKQAIASDKKLFIDIGATYCAACTQVEKKVLKKPEVIAALQNFVVVKIESDINDSYPTIKKLYGNDFDSFPTLFLVNPTTHEIYKKWQGELLDTPLQEFINELTELK